MDTYATINDMQEISRNTSYLLGNVYARIGENCGNRILCGQCADDADSQVAVDDIMGKSHKMIAQINRTNQLHKTR